MSPWSDCSLGISTSVCNKMKKHFTKKKTKTNINSGAYWTEGNKQGITFLLVLLAQ